MKAVAYCRVSTKEQVRNTSLETQQQAIRAYCDREGIEVVRVFLEEGESAKTADRTQLRELLAYCRSSPVDLVLVWKFDRFARDLEQHIGLRTKLRSLGVQVRSVTEPVGEDPAGKLMENVLASFAQFDNDVRAQRTRAGMKARAEQGYWTTRTPIGYVRVVDHKGKSNLAADPDRAPFVRTAFDLVARGTVAIEDVRRQLVAEGFKTTTGRPVAPQTFHRMLRNPAYSGRVVVESLGVDVPAAFPALVDDRTFAAVQQRLGSGGPPRRRDGDEDFPLRRFAFCAGCARPMAGCWSKGRRNVYPYYRCRACRGMGVRRGVLHASFVAHLDMLSIDTGYLPLFREVVRDVFQRDAELGAVQRGRLTRELNTLGDKERQLRQAFIYDGRIDQAVYDQESGAITARRSELQHAILLATTDDPNIDTLIDQCEHLLSDLGTAWKRAPAVPRRALQALVFPDGVAVRDKAVRTPRPASAFAAFPGFRGQKNEKVALTGFEPVSPP